MKQDNKREKVLNDEKNTAELDITFIDLKRDFVFKWVFGTEGHEELLLLLIDSILPEKHIRHVMLGAQEQEPDREDAQGGIYDIYCVTDDGSSLTIEMQVCSQEDFNDRMVFYSSFSIRNKVGKGTKEQYDKNLLLDDEELDSKQKTKIRYKLPPIYVIGIVNFELSGINKSDDIIRHFSIREDKGNKGQFTDSIHYVTVELPKFIKKRSELKSKQDFMLYALKNTDKMKEIPKEFMGKGFDKLFEVCSFANMTEDMQLKYVRKMMAEWDREGQLATAVMTGEKKGHAEACTEIAKRMKADGFELHVISEITGLTSEQIKAL